MGIHVDWQQKRQVVHWHILVLSLVVLSFVGLVESAYGLTVSDGKVSEPAGEPGQQRKLDVGPVLGVLEMISCEGWQALPPEVFGVSDSCRDNRLDWNTLNVIREFRATGMATRSFQRGQRLVVVRVYHFSDSQAAFGAYTILRSGARSGVLHGDASSEDDQSISFWQDNYFVNVYTTSDGDDEAKELVIWLADKLSGAVGSHAPMPPAVATLPPLDKIQGSERLLMGPFVARLVAPVPYVATLLLNCALATVSADYQFRQPFAERLRLLLIDYGEPVLAARIYNQYASELAKFHRADKQSTSSLFKVFDSYLLCQLQGTRLSIITGAHKRLSAEILARQLVF
ncbi:MAG: hypothetical protein HY711_08440 [Candidatus Melainabacteria bacterium]|nr:hypothetical protein [Candidatus Melainabacteria bacterium]